MVGDDGWGIMKFGDEEGNGRSIYTMVSFGAGETRYIVGAGPAGGQGSLSPYTIKDDTSRALINTIAGIEIAGTGTEGSMSEDATGRLYKISEDSISRTSRAGEQSEGPG